MKRQNLVLMLLLAVMLVASTAESKEFGNARQTAVLECGVVTPDFPPPGFVPIPEVIAVSVTSGAPAFSIGDPCGNAINELVNNRFRLLSATPTLVRLSIEPAITIEVSAVQYLFVSKPGREGDD